MYPLDEIKKALGDDYKFSAAMTVDELKKSLESGNLPQDNVPIVLEVGNLDIEITIYSNESDDSLYLGYFCCVRTGGEWDSYDDIFVPVNLEVPDLEAEMYRVLSNYANEKNLSFFTQNESLAKDNKLSNEIFILYSCNDWKEHSSMRLITASSDMATIYCTIAKEILEGNMDYDLKGGNEGLTEFKADFQAGTVNLSLLNCGYVETTANTTISELIKAKEYRDIFSILSDNDTSQYVEEDLER